MRYPIKGIIGIFGHISIRTSDLRDIAVAIHKACDQFVLIVAVLLCRSIRTDDPGESIVCDLIVALRVAALNDAANAVSHLLQVPVRNVSDRIDKKTCCHLSTLPYQKEIDPGMRCATDNRIEHKKEMGFAHLFLHIQRSRRSTLWTRIPRASCTHGSNSGSR